MPRHPAPNGSPPPARRPSPWLWGAAALTALLGSALAFSLGQWDSRLAPGVRIAGVEVGGLSHEEAQARLSRELSAAPQVKVHAADKSWQLSAAELGWQRDTAAALEAAQAYTAQRSLAQRLQGILARPGVRALLRGSIEHLPGRLRKHATIFRSLREDVGAPLEGSAARALAGDALAVRECSGDVGKALLRHR